MSDSETRVWLDRPNRLVFLDDSGLYHLFDIASGRCVQTFRYTAFRDVWTPLAAVESGTVASDENVGGDLPEPDATNPDHLYWVASVLHQAEEKFGRHDSLWAIGGWEGVSKHVDAEADRLDAARSAEREREQRIEAAAKVLADFTFVADRDDAARALDAAGLLRGGGRGE